MNNEQINDLLKQLQEQWAPALLATAAKIVFWDAVGWLTIGMLCAVVCGVSGRQAYRWAKGCETSKMNEDEYLDNYMPGILLTGIASALAGVFASFMLLNIWNWVALFDPQLAVAHRVLETIVRK